MLGVVACLLPLAALAQTPAPGEPSMRIGWPAASGPVATYQVWASIGDGPMEFYGETPETQATVSGSQFQLGDALRFQVVARAADGRLGPPSEISGVIFFGAVPVPQNVTVVSGSAKYPNQVGWDPVPGVDFYLVFRGPDGSAPQLLREAYDPSLDDETAPIGVRMAYTVAAVSRRQISAYSTPVYATRTGGRPTLVASVTSLSHEVTRATQVLTDTIELRNTGDWVLSWAAWPLAPWVTISPGNDALDGEVDHLTVTYRLDKLGIGVHDSTIQLYTYYDPPPGEAFELGPPIEIPIHLTVRDQPPSLDFPAFLSIAEGQVVDVPIHAADPDPGSDVQIDLDRGVPFASLSSLAAGDASLTLAPGSGSAGTYTLRIVAWDRNSVGSVAVGTLNLTVVRLNHAPVIDPIPNQSVHVGQSSFVNFRAQDPDGDRIAFTTSTLPSFVQFFDKGNGTGTFVITPTPSDLGKVLVILGAVDDGSPSRFAGMPFQINVDP